MRGSATVVSSASDIDWTSVTKKIARGDRFLRTGKNTFALRPEAR